MRELTAHKVNGLNDALRITVLDEEGPGGANHHYSIAAECQRTAMVDVSFQNGPINEAGVNGVSNEALVAIVIDRLQGFQKGQYSCRENALALTKLEESMHWMLHRTRERTARGVEGTMKP